MKREDMGWSTKSVFEWSHRAAAVLVHIHVQTSNFIDLRSIAGWDGNTWDTGYTFAYALTIAALRWEFFGG